MAQTSQGMVWLGRLRAALLDTLFPLRCAGCHQLGALWCAACQSSVTRICPPFCLRCGQPFKHGQVCDACQRFPLSLNGIRSVTLFEGPLRQAVHAFKYSGCTDLALPLGQLLEHYWADNPFPVDAIVPVPLYASRLRERGYNQSALLARHLARAVHAPVVEDGLARVRATASQMTLSAAERQANVKDAFEGVTARVTGQRVVLIDDVCTTGATLEACSVALLRAGAVSVWALTLARAV